MNMLVNPFTRAGGAATTGPASNQNPQAQSPNGPNASNPNSGTDPTGNVGNNNINPGNDGGDVNANPNGTTPSNNPQNSDALLTDFSKLWETPVIDPKNPPATPQPYVPAIDPKALGETIGKMNFTNNITPEQKAAMLSGGEAGLNAMLEMINSAGRQATAIAYQASTQALTKGLDNAEKGILGKVPSSVKAENLSNMLATNPLMAKPEYQPLVNSVKQQFLDRFPKATPDQLSGAVTKYFDNMVADAKGENKTQANNDTKLRSGAGDADWMEWAATEMGVQS